MTHPTVRQMIYFEALAQTLHFGRAAELSGVTQPALSAQIAEMEERLGCRLFERGGRAVQMTETALALQPRIERILTDIREVESLARRERGDMQGRFRLGMIPTVAPYILPHILPELKSRFPALLLELREAVTQSLVTEATAGRLDGFVAALPLDHPGLVTETLFEDRFFLAVPDSDPAFALPPVPPDSPALERLMLLEEGHCLRDQALAFCATAARSRSHSAGGTAFGASSLATVMQMVANGYGVTLIPQLAADVERRDGRVKFLRLENPQPGRRVGLVFRRSSPRKADFATLGELVTECLDMPAVKTANRKPR